jgi:endonuclease G
MKKLSAILCLLTVSIAFAQDETADLIKEHVYGGLPSSDDLMVRTAYVLDYDAERKSPRWVAYHLTEDYRRTPKRTGKWSSYRNDPDRDGEPKESDYRGVFADDIRNYARGHLAPFMISGGDRDGDGMVLDADKDGKVEAGDDPDEGDTVKEINYHSNLTPQHHNAFNGSGGVWFEIEARVRELQEEHEEVWVFAGPIFGDGIYDTVGDGVQVAPMFFQIIIWETNTDEPEWEAYMMPHHQANHGSIMEQRVSVRHIEAMTGLDFFSELDLGDSERVSTYEKD